ncbi:hypothetical protein [Streptomyces sp. NPDC053367]|uniref:hypothetical protein n=1 Tax=Streptomyces sp. NPDC053367 TaxID=3365700 RepID=UPI0037D7EAF2
MTGTNTLTLGGLLLALIILTCNLHPWWTGGRNAAQLKHFGQGFGAAACAAACPGGILGWAHSRSGTVGNGVGERAGQGLTGTSQAQGLTTGQLVGLGTTGAAAVVIAFTLVVLVYKAAGKKERRRIVGGAYVGSTLCLTAGVAGRPGLAARRPQRRWRWGARRGAGDGNFVIRLAAASDRLATGSVVLARRIGNGACAWCARARRDDLTGVHAILGNILRAGLLILGAYTLARVVRAVPALMWVLTAGWTVAAWRTGRPAKAPADAPVDEPAQLPGGTAVRALLLELMGEASGVHLRTVLARLQREGHWEGRTVTDMRLQLERLGIPSDRNVKVAGVPTWGVRRRDLEAPSPAAAEATSAETSTAA